MHARARVMGHAIHPLLIVFPLGLLSTAVIFDIIYLATDRDSFSFAAAYAIGIGIIGGLVAAVFGLIDATGIPSGTRARRIALVHGGGNVVVVALFAVSWFLRASATDWKSPIALVFSFAGIVLAVFTGWLGGELVERLGVGVDDDAGLNASNSMSHAPSTGMPRR
jgi:uncharacterized membrane protein